MQSIPTVIERVAERLAMNAEVREHLHTAYLVRTVEQQLLELFCGRRSCRARLTPASVKR